MFFALSWSWGMTKPYYRTRFNLFAVNWWWICIAIVLFIKISPFYLFFLNPHPQQQKSKWRKTRLRSAPPYATVTDAGVLGGGPSGA